MKFQEMIFDLSLGILITWPNHRSCDLYLAEKLLDIQHLTNVTSAHFVAKCHVVNFSPKSNSPASDWDSNLSVIVQSLRFMTIGEDTDKDRFENWHLCGVSKLPFCDNISIKVILNWVSFINPCIHLLGPLSVTRECHSKVANLNLSNCCSALPLRPTFNIYWLGFWRDKRTSVIQC